jgi:hypothetical protein
MAGFRSLIARNFADLMDPARRGIILRYRNLDGPAPARMALLFPITNLIRLFEMGPVRGILALEAPEPLATREHHSQTGGR